MKVTKYKKPVPCKEHNYGPGYYDIEHGVRVRHTRVCSVCNHKLVEAMA